LAFSSLDWFEPCDYWRLVNAVEKASPNISLELICLLIKLGNWDPMLFQELFPQILKRIPEASDEMKQNLKEVFRKVEENFYPVGADDEKVIDNWRRFLEEH
jgi:hypothetical protein